MQLKRYEAKSVNEAMEKIKKDLGANAVVLSTKRLKGTKNNVIEVIAARDEDLDIIKKGNWECEATDDQKVYSTIKTDINDLKSLILDLTNKKSIFTELTEIKENLNTFFDFWGIRKNGKASSHLSKAYYHLLTTGISKKQAVEIMEKLRNNHSPQELKSYEQTLRIVENMIKESIALPYLKQGEKKRVRTFVGPAGAGKTTTLAKLAAHHAFEDKLKVGIVTMDTYRIGATDQLKKYADIMDIPMEVASEENSFQKAVSRFADRDIILVDTPGRSRRDERYIMKLKDVFAALPSVETNLVLSVTESGQCMTESATRFNVMEYNNMIFTKLDENNYYGSIYNIIDKVNKPVSYVTDGQNVPRDIRKVDPVRLARLIVNNGMNNNSFAISN